MMDPDYDLFVAAARHGSLSAGGRTLGVSATMASRRIGKLEQRLGAQLIHRSTRRFALTEAGERFHIALQHIQAQLHEAEVRVSGRLDTPSGPFRISAPTSFGRLYIAPLLPAFLRRYPQLSLSVDLSDGFVDLVAARVDCAIRIASDIPASLESYRLGDSRRVLCAAPGYLASAGTPATIDDLAAHRLLAAEGQLPWRLLNGHRYGVVDRQSHVGTNSSELVRELTLSGMGIALRSLWDVGDALRDGRLVRVLPDWEGSSRVGIHAVHTRQTMVPPAVPAFIAFLREWLDPAAWDRAD